MIAEIVGYLQWFFLTYMVCLSGCYFILNIISIVAIVKHMQAYSLDYFMDSFSEFLTPISVLVPAFNEENNIVDSVRSLLQLIYSEYEVIVINDGSLDSTLPVLIDAFELVAIPEAYPVRIPVQNLRGFYRSNIYPNLKVIDKENGGKSDALNAGINAARYPLFCTIDADSILQRDSLNRIVQPMMKDPRVVAVGGTIRILNGSKINEGQLVRAGLPSQLLVRMQIIEYLRAFLFGRLGWSPLNGMLIISGAFGLFQKQSVLDVGGYSTDTVGEDMELVLRLHRELSRQKKDYRIVFVPDPICWTEAPADLPSLKSQRIRWQKGLVQSLSKNRTLLFSSGGSMAGWLAFPFMLIFELIGPFIEVSGYFFVLVAFLFNLVSWQFFLLFIGLAVGLGMLISVTALLLEEISFHVYSSYRQIWGLFLASIFENFGYRQLITIWRLEGLLHSLRSQVNEWGTIQRSETWQGETTS